MAAPPAATTDAESILRMVDELTLAAERRGEELGGTRVAHLLNGILDECIAELAGVEVESSWRQPANVPTIPGGWFLVRWRLLLLRPEATATLLLKDFASRSNPVISIDKAVARARRGEPPFIDGPIDGETLASRLKRRRSQGRRKTPERLRNPARFPVDDLPPRGDLSLGERPSPEPSSDGDE